MQLHMLHGLMMLKDFVQCALCWKQTRIPRHTNNETCHSRCNDHPQCLTSFLGVGGCLWLLKEMFVLPPVPLLGSYGQSTFFLGELLFAKDIQQQLDMSKGFSRKGQCHVISQNVSGTDRSKDATSPTTTSPSPVMDRSKACRWTESTTDL